MPISGEHNSSPLHKVKALDLSIAVDLEIGSYAAEKAVLTM